MPQVSEKWEIQVNNKKYVISGAEKELILLASERGSRFVKFRDLIINPAFVSDFVLLKSESAGLLEAPNTGDQDEETWLANQARIQEMKKEAKIGNINKSKSAY